MAEHHSGPVETGAPMDYAEHEKTYNLFFRPRNSARCFCVALLIAMAAGFFTGAGFSRRPLGVLILLNVAGFLLLR